MAPIKPNPFGRFMLARNDARQNDYEDSADGRDHDLIAEFGPGSEGQIKQVRANHGTAYVGSYDPDDHVADQPSATSPRQIRIGQC